jgi:hypothetical protein
MLMRKYNELVAIPGPGLKRHINYDNSATKLGIPHPASERGRSKDATQNITSLVV